MFQQGLKIIQMSTQCLMWTVPHTKKTKLYMKIFINSLLWYLIWMYKLFLICWKEGDNRVMDLDLCWETISIWNASILQIYPGSKDQWVRSHQPFSVLDQNTLKRASLPTRCLRLGLKKGRLSSDTAGMREYLGCFLKSSHIGQWFSVSVLSATEIMLHWTYAILPLFAS